VSDCVGVVDLPIRRCFDADRDRPDLVFMLAEDCRNPKVFSALGDRVPNGAARDELDVVKTSQSAADTTSWSASFRGRFVLEPLHAAADQHRR
jgi:hypothetical protein